MYGSINKYFCINIYTISTVLAPKAPKVQPAKSRKRKGPTATEATVGHAECISPNPCKKCCFMRRLGKFRWSLLTYNYTVIQNKCEEFCVQYVISIAFQQIDQSRRRRSVVKRLQYKPQPKR